MYQILLIVVFAGLAATSPTPPIHDCDIKANHCMIPCFENAQFDLNRIVFRLFTNSSSSSQVVQFNNDSSLQASYFNHNYPTRVIIHGCMGDGESNVNKEIRTAYVENGQYNIFVVDWGAYSYLLKVGCIRQRVREIGTLVGEFISWVSKTGHASLKTISVIGYSFGAHVSGYAGKYLNSQPNGKLHTIVGLDPAGVCFEFKTPQLRLNSTDAEYVEVIHTSKTWGTKEPIGTSDFYPNGGLFQPGCTGTWMCSHRYSFRYFAQSIRNASQYMSTKCLDYKEMESGNCTSGGPMIKMGGEPSNHGLAEGIYYNSNGSKLINHMFLTFTVIIYVFVKTLTV